MKLPAPNAGATAFADLVPQFELKLVPGLSEWPIATATSAGQAPKPFPVNVLAAANKKEVLQALADEFGTRINNTVGDRAPKVEDTAKLSVNKYLPETYRGAFNFTSPRTDHAKVDDSYHCAIRKPREIEEWAIDDKLSWGQVFAHILRQPLLAKACGMIYETSIDITEGNASLFKKGCYIYADIVNPEYKAIQEQPAVIAAGPFIKPYAARIPKLKPGAENKRPVFAPILFPVLYQTGIIDPEPPKAPWDEIFAELNEYNDGFAKIMHVSQPVSTETLAEQPNGSHPVKDDGIRMAWDDEQILIWYMRQLDGYKENPAAPGAGERIDAPLGIYGYRVDVKPDTDAGDWESLNMVRCKESYRIGRAAINNEPGQLLELPFQVFPSQIDNDKTAPFWLPMYYTAWTGKNLVLKDSDAIAIHLNDEPADGPGPETRQVDPGNLFEDVAPATKLVYGDRYRFRVRMMDLSGGGPDPKEEIYNNSASHFSKWSFKRYIAPAALRVTHPEKLSAGQAEYFNEQDPAPDGKAFVQNPELRIRRPLLNYPAVVYTNKYADPVQLLIDSSRAQRAAGTPARRTQVHTGIADPDVAKVSVKVEVETLRLDNLASDSGNENYITLYKTERSFPAGFEDEMVLPVNFIDVPVLRLDSNDNFFDRDDLDIAAIHAMTEIPLPTARKIRITVRAICGDAEQGNETYYGVIDTTNPDRDSRYGRSTQYLFYYPSMTEENLLMPVENVPVIQALYLQPDPEYVRRGKIGEYFFFSELTSNQPDIMQRLAQQLGVRVKGLTLVAEKGKRVVFGCSNKIRHHLAPDGSSITFSSKADLCDHWLGCITYRMARDWTWDALQKVAFTFTRWKKFRRSDEVEERRQFADIEIGHSASFESLIPDTFGNLNRQETTIIFIDAIEPKTSLTQNEQGEPRFPDELDVWYKVHVHFRDGHGTAAVQEYDPAHLHLPTTINPKQVPKIAGVGLAFSKYIKGEKYKSTEPRQRYLWVELEEAVRDPHDTLFCRVLHYAPDQLVSNNKQRAEMERLTQDPPPLPIDPEYIRILTPVPTDDMAGLSAMQAMEKAADGDNIHYLLPLPPGLHAESPELFGFFTYEFRIGHGHWSKNDADNLFSTAQGRFGRPQVITGMQHPAPTLLCNVTRDDLYVKVNAPYAKAVWQGKNVTSDPPRTQLHAVLYAQVMQADGEEYRNILVDTRYMTLAKPPAVSTTPPRGATFGMKARDVMMENTRMWSVEQTDEIARAQVVLSNMTLMDEVSKLDVDAAYTKKVTRAMTDYRKGKTVKMDLALARNVLDAFDKLKQPQASLVQAGAAVTNASLLAGQLLASFKDLAKTATVTWTNKEIAVLLNQLGLPDDAALSVVAVEVFGNITSLVDQIDYMPDEALQDAKKGEGRELAEILLERRRKNRNALTAELGNYRILRTSPLTEVPFVCCTTCD
ncbi:MAG: hypothetical protein EOO05_03490 [Chitinophagaceae bacterium]|nr:MAG: hypothetical protein EOO05_03490 [Chitinophagaceae bacterium]